MAHKVSVVVSAYDRTGFLRLALLSLACQSVPPHEVILADDGSPLDLGAVVRPLARKLGLRVIHVRQEHRGFRLARSRNNAIRVSTGDYLVFTDQDIVFPRRYLERHLSRAKPGRFLVSYPARLDASQTGMMTEDVVRNEGWVTLLTRAQRRKVVRQWVKERLYALGVGLGVRPIGPKVIGCAFGIHREDLVAVNGFDEAYEGWGNEDDDLGWRLYRAGVRGANVFRDAFPVHLWHPHASGGTRPNLAYFRSRKREIRKGDVRCRYGLDNPSGDDPPCVEILS